MDAVKFLEKAKKMCESHACCVDNGKECPIYHFRNGTCIGTIANITEADKFSEIVNAVEEWSMLKTRNGEFLKHYPNADVFKSGVVNICPKLIDKRYSPSAGCLGIDCYDCKVKYWMQVIE